MCLSGLPGGSAGPNAQANCCGLIVVAFLTAAVVGTLVWYLVFAVNQGGLTGEPPKIVRAV